MTLLSCGCDIDANAITLCKVCYNYFLKTGCVTYTRQNRDLIAKNRRG